MICSAPRRLADSTAMQADGAVADHGDPLARRDTGHLRCVVAGAEHVGQGEQRRDECRVGGDGKFDEGAVGEWHADGFGLSALVGDAVPERGLMVDAGGLQVLAAEFARVVRDRERGDDEVALLQRW